MCLTNYGICEKCSAPLNPVWFKEDEVVIKNNTVIYTGRTKRSCDYLECIDCYRKYVVDDSFDGPWI